ncbi:hypothetical protein E2C01_005121 [Portunus trituberculatus]|uniref:Uncharacterized protein n=1 Tax=Portunus trituberculatus TaxID=210409 RepID=A0A5B7CRJ2_PORTR|nr:hypothetical protein [Portunus trituberculatus]
MKLQVTVPWAMVVVVVVAHAQGGVAAPQGTSSLQASCKNGRRVTNLKQIGDILFLAVPEMTPLLETLIEEMNEIQLQNMEMMLRFIVPFVEAFLKVQIGEDEVEQKEKSLLDGMEFFSKVLSSIIQKRKEKLKNPRQSTPPVPETIPDYTDLLDHTPLTHHTPLPDHTRLSESPLETTVSVSNVSPKPLQIQFKIRAPKTLQDNSSVSIDHTQDKPSLLKAAVSVGTERSEIVETSTTDGPEKTHPDVRLKDKNQRPISHRYDLFFKPLADDASGNAKQNTNPLPSVTMLALRLVERLVLGMPGLEEWIGTQVNPVDPEGCPLGMRMLAVELKTCLLWPQA